MKKIITIATVLLTAVTNAQNIGINSTGAAANSSALLDVDAAPNNDKGVLLPRVALTAANNPAPVTSPVVSLIVYNTATAGTPPNNVVPGFYYWEGTKWVPFGAASPSVPIGSIIAWHKSFANTPALPAGWVECNGQTLNNPASPYNGQVIPNLNSNTQDGSINSGMFLRGASTSGTMQADGTAPNGLSGTVFGLMSANNVSSQGGGWWNGNTQAPVTFSSTDSETRPANMSVVWIMRVE